MKADNLPMSAEKWVIAQDPKKFNIEFDNIYLIMDAYANYLLSHHINVLAENIAENAELEGDEGSDFTGISLDKNSIRKIAKDYINELNLNK